MEQSRYVRQVLSLEVHFILSRISVVILFIEFGFRVFRLNTVFSVNRGNIDCLLVFWVLSISPNGLDLTWLDGCDGEVFDDFQTSSSSPSSSCNGKDHGRELFGYEFFFHSFSYLFEVIIALLDILVLVCTIALQ